MFSPAAPVFLLMKGKDIDINKGVVLGLFGSTSTTLMLSSGVHGSLSQRIAVWQRTLQVNARSTVTVNAVTEDARVASRRTH